MQEAEIDLQDPPETARPGLTYATAKEVALAEGVSANAVKQWVADGVVEHAYKLRGRTGRMMVAVRNDGHALRKGESPDGEIALTPIDPEVVRTVLREGVELASRLPPLADAGAEALERGEPVPVVVARIEAESRFRTALLALVGVAMVLFVALGALAMTLGRRLRFRV